MISVSPIISDFYAGETVFSFHHLIISASRKACHIADTHRYVITEKCISSKNRCTEISNICKYKIIARFVGMYCTVYILGIIPSRSVK